MPPSDKNPVLDVVLAQPPQPFLAIAPTALMIAKREKDKRSLVPTNKSTYTRKIMGRTHLTAEITLK